MTLTLTSIDRIIMMINNMRRLFKKKCGPPLFIRVPHGLAALFRRSPKKPLVLKRREVRCDHRFYF
jgi:hypothetical protein